MASNTTNMGLRSWDSPGDAWSYSELAGNWTKVDQHDHSTGKGVQIPTAGLANLSVTGPKLAVGAVSDATKVADGILTDAKLVSPSSAAYKVLAFASGWGQFTTSGDWYHSDAGSLKRAGSGSDGFAPIFLPIRAADLAVAGKTTVLRIRVSYMTNGIAPTIGFTSGIWPVTAVSGGANILDVTTGSRLGDVVVSAQAVNTQGSAVGADFAFPTDGNYVFGCRTVGTQATNSFYGITTFVQYRYV